MGLKDLCNMGRIYRKKKGLPSTAVDAGPRFIIRISSWENAESSSCEGVKKPHVKFRA